MEDSLIFPAIQRVSGEYDPWLRFIQVGPTAMHLARFVMQFAVHHSDFRVGAVVLAESPERGLDGLFWGANQNLEEGQNNTKACAEEVAITKVLEHGFSRIHAIFVAGEAQPDTHSQIKSETLHSCGNDRENYWELWERNIISFDCPLVSVDARRDIFEKYSHANFQKIHALKLVDELQAYHDPGFVKWQSGERLYLGKVDSDLLAGREPDRPLLAHLAVTGQLAAAA